MATTLIAFALCKSIDGDTISCGRERIRLARIDAAEVGELGADDATDALRLMIDGSRVLCVVKTRDVYGRMVGECFTGEGPSLSDRLLQRGLVNEYRRKR